MYAPPRPSPAHEAVSQPSPTANHSPVPLVQLSTGKRKRKPTSEGQGGDAEGSEEIAGASGSVPNVMASGPRANAQHPLPPDTKKRTKTQRACDSCRSRKIRQVFFPRLTAISCGFTPSSHAPFLTLSYFRILVSTYLLTHLSIKQMRRSTGF